MKDYSDIINIKRPPLKHPRMTLENRAKCYAPFDALRGFSLAILTKQVEQEFVTSSPLSDDAEDQLDYKLHRLKIGVQATVTFFCQEKHIGGLERGRYITKTGIVEAIDTENRKLVLSCGSVAIKDILEIESSAFNNEYADTSEVKPYAG